MTARVLFVDDDVNLLSALRRGLRKKYDLATAEGGIEAIKALKEDDNFAVIVADMRMPKMNGVDLLKIVHARFPRVIRLMMTGNNDLETAMKAVNDGHVFRFLTKPCEPELLLRSIDDALRQHQLEQAERSLLENTLTGTIHLLTDILTMVDEGNFVHQRQMLDDLNWLCDKAGVRDTWEIEIAARVHNIGMVGLPPESIVRWRNGRILSAEEQVMIAEIPVMGSQFIANIPRLEGVAQILMWQDKHYDGSGHPPGGYKGEEIPVGSRILAILKELAAREAKGMLRLDAVKSMAHQEDLFDPDLVGLLLGRYQEDSDVPDPEEEVSPSEWRKERKAKDLQVGNVVLADVKTNDGTVLLSAGKSLTGPMLQRLVNFARLGKLVEPIPVNTSQEQKRGMT